MKMKPDEEWRPGVLDTLGSYHTSWYGVWTHRYSVHPHLHHRQLTLPGSCLNWPISSGEGPGISSHSWLVVPGSGLRGIRIYVLYLRMYGVFRRLDDEDFIIGTKKRQIQPNIII